MRRIIKGRDKKVKDDKLRKGEKKRKIKVNEGEGRGGKGREKKKVTIKER